MTQLNPNIGLPMHATIHGSLTPYCKIVRLRLHVMDILYLFEYKKLYGVCYLYKS